MTPSVKSMAAWLDSRLGYSSTIKPLIEHPVPPTGWDYTIGSATLIAFVVQVVTGVALAFTYVPTPDNAYASLVFITDVAVLGNIVRGIHFWGASAMVLLVSAHAAQVFLVGAFKYPREVNWLSGTLLLVFTFGMAFTGQLLRWNQDAYWAVVVGAVTGRTCAGHWRLAHRSPARRAQRGWRNPDPLLRRARVHDSRRSSSACSACICSWSFGTVFPSRRYRAWSSIDARITSGTRN